MTNLNISKPTHFGLQFPAFHFHMLDLQKDGSSSTDHNQQSVGSQLPPHLVIHSGQPGPAEGLAVRGIIDNINRILSLTTQHRAGSKLAAQKSSNSSQREAYRGLLSWHERCLSEIRSQLKQSQITAYNSIQQQHSVLLATMQQLGEQVSKQCQQKGLLVRILTLHHLYLHQDLVQYMDDRLRANLSERVFSQTRMETEFLEEARLLKDELESLKEGKDKKWKNLFMLIKDNRLLRRTKGKLMRELQASLYKQQQYKENILELTKENERYKLLSHSLDYEEDGLQKWLKNLSSLIKIERYIQKEPFKAKRILQFELENLQINEMEALPEKIEYVIKAIEEAEELVDYYEDLNDLIAPCKLLLNNYAQTELKQESTGTNTPCVKYANAYSQARPAFMPESSCQLVSSVFKMTLGHEKFKQKSNGEGVLRKASIFSQGRSERTLAGFLGARNGYGKQNLASPGFLRISRTMEQTIAPLYIPMGPAAKINHLLVYKDSKFLQKLALNQKQVHVKVNGISGFQAGSSIKQSQKSPHKRYTQLSSSYQPVEGFKVETGEKEGKALTQMWSKLGMKSDQFQAPPSNTWLNNKNKRYSYNSRLLPLQSKYKKVDNLDELSLTDADLHQTSRPNHEGNAELRESSESPSKPTRQQEQPEGEGSTGMADTSRYKANHTNSLQQESEEMELAGGSINLEAGFRALSKQDKLTKMKSQIQKISKRNNGPTQPRKNSQVVNLSGFGNRNSRSSSRSVRTNHFTRNEDQVQNNIIKKATHQNSTMNKRSSYKILKTAGPADHPQANQSYAINLKWQQETKNGQSKESTSDGAKTQNSKSKAAHAHSANGIATTKRPANDTDRACSSFSINIRSSYQVAPILEEEILEENNLHEDQISQSHHKLSSKETEVSPSNPVFEPEPEIAHVDAQKIMGKILHLLFINRNELKNSQKTLREYIETNLKNIYGLTLQSHYGSFNKSLALSTDPTPSASCFMRLLNYSTPIAYQSDLFKLYLILLDKCGNISMNCEMEKATKIIEYVTAIFYYEADVPQVVREIQSNLVILSLNTMPSSKTTRSNLLSKISNLSVNLSQYFLILESDLRVHCLQTQFYQFCQEILPENETDLSYQQFLEFIKFLPESTELEIHVARLKRYFSNDKAKSHCKITGMKLHKISLYCSRQKWKSVRDVFATVEHNFKQEIDDPLCTEDLIELFNRLDKGEFGECRAKTTCSWIYGLAKNHVRRGKDYGSKISKTLLKLIWLVETNLRIQLLGLLGSNLEILGKEARKIIVGKELSKFVSLKKEDRVERQRWQQKQNKWEDADLSWSQGRYFNSTSANLVKSNKTINTTERK